MEGEKFIEYEKKVRKMKLEDKDPIKAFKILVGSYVLINEFRRRGLYEKCIEFSRKMKGVVDVVYKHFYRYPSEQQYHILSAVLESSDYLYYEEDEKDFQRIMDLAEQFVDEKFLKNCEISEVQKNELHGRCLTQKSKFIRKKRQYNLLHLCMDLVQKGEEILSKNEENLVYYKLHFIEKMMLHLEYSVHYEFGLYIALRNRFPLQSHGFMKKKPSQKFLRTHHAKFLGEKLPLIQVMNRVKCHAEQVIKIFESEFGRNITREVMVPQIMFPVMLCVGIAYFYLDDTKNSLGHLNRCESDILRKIGSHYPFVLGEVYEWKSYVFNKLGMDEDFEKCYGRYKKHQCSGSSSSIPKDKDPLYLDEFDAHLEIGMRAFMLAFHFNTCDRKQINSKFLEFCRKKKTKKCSNLECDKIDRKGKRFEMCSRCNSARYCSRECQEKHWRSGHKKDCKVYVPPEIYFSESV